jgi:hypothetical protein
MPNAEMMRLEESQNVLAGESFALGVVPFGSLEEQGLEEMRGLPKSLA